MLGELKVAGEVYGHGRVPRVVRGLVKGFAGLQHDSNVVAEHVQAAVRLNAASHDRRDGSAVAHVAGLAGHPRLLLRAGFADVAAEADDCSLCGRKRLRRGEAYAGSATEDEGFL